VQGRDAGDDVPRAAGVEVLDRHQADVPVHPDHPDAVVADGPDRAGRVRAVAVVVHRVVVVVGEVPAEEVVPETVAVAVAAGGPAALGKGREDVGAVDVAVAVYVVDQPGVGRAVQVPEVDPPVAVHVLQVGLVDHGGQARAGVPLGGDFALVDPGIQVQ